MFEGVFSEVAKRASYAIVSDITASGSHSSAGWPTIEESFDIDTMGRRFNLAIKTLETIDSSGNRMANRNAKSESLRSTSNLVDKLSSPFALSSLINDLKDVFLQSSLFKGRLPKPVTRMLGSFS